MNLSNSGMQPQQQQTSISDTVVSSDEQFDLQKEIEIIHRVLINTLSGCLPFDSHEYDNFLEIAKAFKVSNADVAECRRKRNLRMCFDKLESVGELTAGSYQTLKRIAELSKTSGLLRHIDNAEQNIEKLKTGNYTGTRHKVLATLVKEAVAKAIKAQKLPKVDIQQTLHFHSTDKESEKLAEDIVFKVMNIAIEKIHTSKDVCTFQNILKTVYKFLLDFEKYGIAVVGVDKKCIVIAVQYETYEAVLSLLDYMDSKLLKGHLEELSRDLGQHIGTNIQITCSISNNNLSSIWQELENLLRETKLHQEDVCMSLEYSTAEGFKHLVDNLESGGADNNLNQLSEELSLYIGKPIKVTSSLDLNQIHEALSNAGDITTTNNKSLESGRSKTEMEYHGETSTSESAMNLSNSGMQLQQQQTSTRASFAKDTDNCPTLQMNNAEDLGDAQQFLRAEECNRIAKDNGNQSGYTLIACVSQIIKQSEESLIQSMSTFLERHKNQILSVHKLLDSQSPCDLENTNVLDIYFKSIISSIDDDEEYVKYLYIYIYVIATVLQVPLFILCRNANGKLKWEYYPPMFDYNAAPSLNPHKPYITIMMTSSSTFFQIESWASDTPEPHTSGLIGLYADLLQEVDVATISVPYVLLKSFRERRIVQKKEAVEKLVTSDIMKCCNELFKRLEVLEPEQMIKLGSHRPNKNYFFNVIEESEIAFCQFCKVLIKRDERKILEQLCESWDALVNEVDILKKRNALEILKESVTLRNKVVSEALQSCQSESTNFDKRRKTVTTAVIAGSAVGLVGGAMTIAGLVLIPFTFGASLALTIAGGAMGVGGSVTGGGFRVFEAVKQNKAVDSVNSKLKDIQDIEISVWQNLEIVEQLFKLPSTAPGSNSADEVGINLKGFMAIGSAVKSVHGAIGIILAASRIGATGVTLAAHALGPVSMVLDIAFLAEAAHNKATGDKTDAGKILTDIANTIKAKCCIGNSLIMGRNE